MLESMRSVDVGGVSLGVVEVGEGAPVVFVHGFPELAYSWRHQVPAVADAGFRAIAYDGRGYGVSDRPSEIDQYRLDLLVADLVGLLDGRSSDGPRWWGTTGGASWCGRRQS